MNRKQFASSGHYLSLKARYVKGKEHSVSGSTGNSDYDVYKKHDWISLDAEAQSFFIDNSVFHFGVHGKMIMNSQSLFNNYQASILSTSAFSPIPDANTFFLLEYRSPQFAGIGANLIFTIRKNLDLRVDTYFYQPFKQIRLNDKGEVSYFKDLTGNTYMTSGSLIYNSPFGPIRFTTNYFPLQKNPLTFQFSYGYVLFNERAIR
jgi:NTE family protein